MTHHYLHRRRIPVVGFGGGPSLLLQPGTSLDPSISMGPYVRISVSVFILVIDNIVNFIVVIYTCCFIVESAIQKER